MLTCSVPDKIFYDAEPCWLPMPSDVADDSLDEMRDGNHVTYKTLSLADLTRLTVVLYNAPAKSKYIHIMGSDLDCSPAKGFVVSYYKSGMTQPVVCLSHRVGPSMNYPLNSCVLKCSNDGLVDFYMLSLRTTHNSPIEWNISEIHFG